MIPVHIHCKYQLYSAFLLLKVKEHMMRVKIKLIVVGNVIVLTLLGNYLLNRTEEPKLDHNLPTESNDKLFAVGAKRIILWNLFFATNLWPYRSQKTEDHITCPGEIKCILTNDGRNPLDGDALVFHAWNKGSIPKKRHPHQAYVMYSWESPIITPKLIDHHRKNFYNWTYTYSNKSDFTFMHGVWSKLPKVLPDAVHNITSIKKRPKGAAPIAWVVTHCKAKNHREDYVKELKKHIAVDIWGGCGRRCPKGTGRNDVACFKAIATRYKFYLAFENSGCVEYVSFKPYRALQAGMVPIVLGGQTAHDYDGLFPPNAYLDVRNFTSPKHLANYVKMLDSNDERYFAYHAWRTHYMAREGDFIPHWCPLCAALHNKTMVSTPRNVRWDLFWNVEKMCDVNMVKDLLTNKSVKAN